jgi:hypothetical protein
MTPPDKPTYLALWPEPVVSEANVDETLPIRSSFRAEPSLPFSGSTTPERLAELKGFTMDDLVPEKDGNADAEETLMVPKPLIAQIAAGAPFAERMSPTAIPVLSLDDYAMFRVLLRVHGEDHAPTWTRFGVLSRTVKDALQARFAETFQRDVEAQRKFLALVEKYQKEQASKPSGKP